MKKRLHHTGNTVQNSALPNAVNASTNQNHKQQAVYRRPVFRVAKAGRQLLSLLLFLLLSTPLLAQFSTGTGTEADPYLIATKNDLKTLSENTSYWAAGYYFKQTADITFTSTDFASGGDFYNSGHGFNPIGNSSTNFTSSYNGDGHTIDGLYINRPSYNNIGFFGYAKNATINGLSIKNADITGANYVGALGGILIYSKISRCMSSGEIEASGYWAGGGLICHAGYDTISECYSEVTLSCTGTYTGGLVDNASDAVIKNCYFTGEIAGTIGNSFVGYASSTTIENCYAAAQNSVGNAFGGTNKNKLCFYDNEITSATYNYATGLTTAEMQSPKLFIWAGWDFVGETDNGTNDIWDDVPGGYPVLSWQTEANGVLDGTVTYPFSEGTGSEENPFLINSLDDLKTLSESPLLWGKHYRQTTNLTFSAADFESGGDFYNNGEGFSPIGNNDNISFFGSYNGAGHSIDGLYINRPATSYIGLFGYTNEATIENIKLHNVSIEGNNYTASLAGYAKSSSVNNCSVNEGGVVNTVNGYYIGGLVGNADVSNITDCSSNLTSVTGYYSVGGLVAKTSTATITNCKSIVSNISGNERVGGMVGWIDQNTIINQCYTHTTSIVGSANFVGGFAGLNNAGSVINNCYAISGSVTGVDYVGGFLGTLSSSTVSNSYCSAPVSGSGSNVHAVWGLFAGTQTNNYYNSTVAGKSESYATGRTTAQMQVYTNFTGFDFVSQTTDGTDDIWDVDQEGNGYPILSWQEEADNLLFLAPPQGSGTEADPFLITSLKDLVILSRSTEVAKGNYYFKQTADIDASLTQYFDDSDDNGDGNPYNDPADSTSAGNNEGFSPIGINNSNYFRGNYNGDGHTISGLTINRAQQYVGLIGYTNGAVITQLGLDSVNITNAQFYTGGFVGRSEGSSSDSTIISQCYATGTVTTNGSFSYTSGILGSGTYAKITDCYSTAKVTGYQYIGGISGRTRYSTLQNCYAAGPVSGSSSIHSIVGSFSGSSVNNYFNGDVTLNTSTSYSTTNLNSTQMELYSSFANWDFVSETTNGTNDIWDMDQDKAINHGWPILSWQQGADTILINIPFAKGDGTEANPFEIETLEDLAALAADSKLWSFYYKQTADIDASATQYWDDSDDNGDGNPWNDPNDFTSNGNNEGFSPIGIDYTNYFSGNYNGYGHTISGLTINRAQLHVGLFGYTHGTEITQLGLDNVNISNAQTFTGGLVGRSEGSSSDSTIISQCYITGTVTTNGNYDRTGGILGAANNYTKITDCYSTAGVTGYMNIGGITGPMNSSSTIQNCYASGPVNVSVSNYSKPVVYSINGTYSNNYFNGDVTLSTSTSYNVVNLNSTQMELYSSFSGFDFVSQTTDGTDDIWDMDQMRNINSGYPILRWQQGADDVLIDIPFANGDGSELNPFEIATLEDLTALSVNPALWGFNYIQTADIDATATQYFDDSDDDGDGNPYNDANDATTTGDNNGFSPIGISDVPFTGSYNGQGHRISTLTINRPTQNTVGLFGYTTAVIENTSLVNVDITGADYTGALIGNANGDITNCHASGSVSGNSYTGGLTGQFFGEEGNLVTLSQSSSACEVTAESERVGGLIGSSDKVIIEKCFSSGSVTSNSTLANAGGLVGVHVANSENSVIRQSFSSASVTGNTNSGGLLGFCGYGGTIEDCYSTGDVSGNEYIGGLIGYTRSDGTNGAPNITNCYTASPVTGSTNVNAFIGEDLNDDVSLTSCFYNSDVASVSNSLGTGKTTTEMKVYTNFSGFDFARETTDGTDDIWDMDQEETINSGYPIYSWQPGADDILEYLIELAIDSVAPVNTTSATVNVAITKMESSTVSANGLCWNTTGNPTIGDNVTSETILSSTDSLQYQLSGLNEGTTYYVQAYATDADLTYYSNEVSFTTFIAQSITFNALSDKTYGDAAFDLTASSTSGLDVVYTTDAPDVVSISGSTLTIVGAGTATIYANQPGDVTYGAALEVSQSLTVNKKELTVNGATADSKVYDGNNSAHLSGAILSGIVDNDVVTLSADTIGTFSQSNVGENITVTAQLALAGADTVNYSLIQPTELYADITPKELTVSGATADSKVYDGNNSAHLSGAILSGIVDNDVVTLSADTIGTFSQSNVGENMTVTAQLALAGADTVNYSLTQPTGLTADITKKELTVNGATADSKTYDGNNSAHLSGAILSGIVDNDVVTLSADTIGTFSQSNVGENITVTAQLALAGADTVNYSLTQPTGLTADITKKELTVNGVTADSKTYDGNNSAHLSGAILSGIVDNDVITLSTDTIGTFSQSNVGENITVTAQLALAGADTVNYSLTQPTGLTADITKKELTVNGATADSKTYDGNNSAHLSGAILSGIVDNDVVTLSADTIGTFSQSNVGENITVTAQLALAGADTVNYSLTQPTGLTADITKKELTVNGVTADSKTYDGNNSAHLSGAILAGVEGSDDVNLSADTAGVFPQAEVGENLAVTAQLALTGTDIENYILTQPTGLTADITKKELTVIDAVAANKTYDGTTVASITGAVLLGIVEPDEVTLTDAAAGTFAQSSVGENISVTTSMNIAGADTGNYSLTQPGYLTANITEKELTVINALAQNKVYDGNTNAIITGAALFGVETGDTVNLQDATSGTFAQSNAGTGISVTTAITISGAQAANYSITQPAGLTADISKKELTVNGVTADSKTYDGNNSAHLSGAILAGIEGSDDVNLSADTAGVFPQAEVGENLAVTAQLALTGTDIENYILTQPTGLTADITKKELTVIDAVAANKTYDATTVAVVSDATLSGIVEPDEVTLTDATTGTFAQSSVGENISVTTSMNIGGADAGNYSLTQPGYLTANITEKELTVINALAQNKVYDGNTNAIITGAALFGVETGDTVNLQDATSGTFAQSNAGTGISVTTAMTISGAQAANYSITQPAGLTADISKKELTVNGVTADSKVYDGNNSAHLSGAILAGIEGSDDVNLSADTAGVFPQAEVGENLAVTAQLALTGTDIENYILTQPTGLTADITKKELTVIDAVAAKKTYDATTVAVVSDATLSGIVEPDEVTLTDATTGTFAQSSVGENISVTTSMNIGGADAGNYSLTQPGYLTANITEKELTVINALAQNKVYDGNTNAIITGAALFGVETGDTVNLQDATSGTFAQSNAGTGISVTTAMTISGAQAANYSITQPAGLIADISKKELTVNGVTADSKTYDGNNSAHLSGAILAGVEGSDDVNLSADTAGVFPQTEVGENLAVTAQLALTGTDIDNYILTQPTGLTADITKKELTVIDAVAANKTYDGTTVASITGAVLLGIVEPDEVTLTDAAAGTFAQSSVGENISVTTSMNIAGADTGNYSLTQPGYLTANITEKELWISGAKVMDKEYDGTASARVTGAVLEGVIPEDDIVLMADSLGTFTQATVGDSITVTPGIFISGTDAVNYSLLLPALQAKISRRVLNIEGSFAAANKTYDANTDVIITDNTLNLLRVVAGDQVNLEDVEVAFEQADADLQRKVIVTSFTLSGQDTSQYVLSLGSFPQATAQISKKLLTVTADPQSKNIGESNPPLTFSYSGFVAGQNQSVLDVAPYASTSVTSTTPEGVYPGAITISGGQDNNYAFTYIPADFTVINPITDVQIIVDNLSQVYNGEPKNVTVKTEPQGIELEILYNGSEELPVMPGTYSVKVTVTQQGYTGHLTETMVIYDGTAPQVHCQPYEIYLNPGQSYVFSQADIDSIAMGNSEVGYTSDDLTSAEDLLISIEPQSISASDIGSQIAYTVFVTDTTGNVGSCQGTISVRENHAPEVMETAPDTLFLFPDSTGIIDMNQIIADQDSGQKLTYNLEVQRYQNSGGVGTKTVSYALYKLDGTEELPGWITFDAEMLYLELNPTKEDVGTYLFTFTATDALGMKAVKEVLIFVELLTGTPVISIQELNVTVYPNPSAGDMFLKINGQVHGEQSVVYVNNITGEQVLQIPLNKEQKKVLLPMQQLVSGVYTVTLKTSDQTFAKKVILKKR